MSTRIDDTRRLIDDLFVKYLLELSQFVLIPSITFDQGACAEAADWLVAKLEAMTLDRVLMFKTQGNPVIYAEKSCTNLAAPTVLIYGHYDVQRPDPLDAWETPPFELIEREEYAHGRGTSDMKGQLLAVLLAVETLLRSDALGVNLKFLLEGNEEAPPDVLEGFISDHASLLEADISLNCDAGMLAPDRPTISYGLRGGSVNIIRVTGPAMDLHDGSFGGAVQNPIHVLCSLIAGLHDDHGRITLPGFYEKVRILSPEERSMLSTLPIDGPLIAEQAGVSALWGDPDFTPVERIGARPSVNVRQFTAGELKGAIPREAQARLAVRLIPDQDPREVHEQLKRYVEAHTPDTVRSEVEYIVGYFPYLMDRNLPAMRSLGDALKEVWGREPCYQLVGGGIPVVEVLKRILGVESLLTGFGLPGDHIHGPNERLHLPTIKKGVLALIQFFKNFRCDNL